VEIQLVEDVVVTLHPDARKIIHTELGMTPDQVAYQLRLQAEHLSLLAGFESLICQNTLAFAPFDYQINAARTALRRMRGRALLADEVGLGKTIEAGLVIKEYLMRQLAHRILVLTPPGLVEQWQEELSVKFGLDNFITHTDHTFRKEKLNAWEQFPMVIASIATARLAKNRQVIEAIPYDLIVIDEAHHLKNRSSVTWKFVNALQKRYILLLTATPVENSLDELYNLITILKPGLLSTPRAFSQKFVVRGDPRAPKNRGLLRDLLADVMVRHTRSQVDVQLPPRRATTIRLQPTIEERDFYQAVSAFVRQNYIVDDQQKAVSRFILQTIQREAGSCIQATLPTLDKLATKNQAQSEAISHLVEQAHLVQKWTKADALEKLLRVGAAAKDKVIVFTQFRATLSLLAQRLSPWLGDDLVIYHGGLTIDQKQAAIAHFEQDARVLLSTEAAGEGRNLQFCRIMINFDLPWNPQRIEQRVGRIHRIGQDVPVEIFNLATEGTIEDYMLYILDQKLNMFELVIGEVGIILGQLADERDFDDILFETWSRVHSDAEVPSAFETLGENLLQARESYHRVRDYDDALFGEDFSVE
jgi:SNF2 family DNA or RNA helicase